MIRFGALFFAILINLVAICHLQLDQNGTFANGEGSCDQDVLKIPFVTVLDSVVSHSEKHANEELLKPVFSILVLVCISHYPIEWSFESFPMKDKWNVTYSRVARSVWEKSTFSFETRLAFFDVSSPAFTNYRPTCQQVANPDCYRCAVILNNSENSTNGTTPNFSFDLNSKKTIPSTLKNCTSTATISYDSNLQLFYCKSQLNASSMANSSYPKITFRKCSNPTECGNSNDLDLCREINPSFSIKCRNDTKNCAAAQMTTDLEAPTVVTCEDMPSIVDPIGKTGVYVNFFHSTVDDAKMQYPNIYFDWKIGVNTEDLIYLETAKMHIIANEPFDATCTINYYYFARGAHITIKDLSDPLHLEKDLLTMHDISLLETTEVSGESPVDRNYGFVLPIKRTMLARGLLLNIPGDYELTCYAPIWNSVEWAQKTSLVTVTEALLPTFVNGNFSVNLKYHSLLNISCIASARPAPKIVWVFDNDYFASGTIQLDGSDEMVTWSWLTLPKNIEMIRHVIKCRAENLVGYVEKVFIIEPDDDSYGLHSKIATTIMILGFVVNLIVLFFCWKNLFAEKDSMIRNCLRRMKKQDNRTCTAVAVFNGNKVPICCNNVQTQPQTNVTSKEEPTQIPVACCSSSLTPQ